MSQKKIIPGIDLFNVTEEHLSEDFFAVSYMGFMLEHEKTYNVSRDT